MMEVMDSIKRRLIISRGWGGIKETSPRKGCLFIGDVPHELLFPRVAAVVHHGGAGTIATAARAGVPQVVVPYMADQFQWRTQIVKLGLGPHASLFKMLSAKGLSRAVGECLSNEKYRKKAEEISSVLRDTDGVELTVREIERGARK